MKSFYLNKAAVAAATALAAVAPAHAQSSVTLYGIVDTGIGYQSSQTSLGSTSGGRSVDQDAERHLGGQPLRPEGRRRSGRRHEGDLPVGRGL